MESLNVKSKCGDEFVNTKCIENVLHCNNITNRKIRKSRNKTYPDVVSGGLDLPKKVAFETKIIK